MIIRINKFYSCHKSKFERKVFIYNVTTLSIMKKKNVKTPKNFERKHTTITIPKQLYKKVEKKIKNTGFSSVSSYVTYVLRQVVSSESEEAFTEEDEKRVKKRLRELGYI